MTDMQQAAPVSILEPPSASAAPVDLGYLQPPSFEQAGTSPLSSSFSSFNGNTIAQHITYHMDHMDHMIQQQQQQQQQAEQHVGSPPPASCYANGNELIDCSNNQVAERVVELSPNTRYGRLNTLLGKGAFKVVHKAIDREEGYEVAWNVLQIGQENSKDISHEIEILKSVRHPNIIAFHDAWMGQNKTEFVFVTELMTSGTLREYIRKLSTPNPKIVKRWSRQILKGLAYLHDRNPPIIHRDIKCDNIFINGAHNEIKIGDMGTAETMWLGNKKYTLIGTPEFMAPEMYEERGYSEKVDIYAFGMCLLEMVTGEYPYNECSNPAQVFKKVSQHIRPESLQQVTNQQVLDIINNCLSEDENERLSAQELLECSFLAVEPDVQLLATDASHKLLTLQVVFKGSDKVSVKFEFNVEKDTAEEVVAEMIEEQVLPDRYQHWITNELNRILRDLSKEEAEEQGNGEAGANGSAVWRRDDPRAELDKIRQELAHMSERAREAERRRDMLEAQAVLSEHRAREVEQELDKYREPDESHAALLGHVLAAYSDDTSIDDFVRAAAAATNRGEEKACEWAAKLKDQDIMTVGDLRGLLDEDWSGIGLTVFALRALKNMLRQKQDGAPIVLAPSANDDL